MPVYLLPVYEGAMLTTLVDNAVFAVDQDDLGMIARDSRVGDDEVLLWPATYGKGNLLQRDLTLLFSLHKKEIWIFSGCAVRHAAGEGNPAVDGMG